MEGICDVLEESQLFDMGSLKTAVPLISTWREDASELETSTLRTDIIEDITHEPDLVLSSFLKMLPINNNNATDTNNVMDISAISAAISSDSDSDRNSVADVIGTLDKPLDIEATKSQKMSNKLVQPTARGHKKTTKLKFKWYKSFETEESEVELIGSWTEDPIPLKRSVLDPVVYESDELEVTCGVLPESKLCIAPDHELTLEQILIQHYTFEVHLYLDEDLKIAEEIKNKELTVDSDALRRDIASSRQEELSLMATDEHPTKSSSVDKTKSSSTAPISRGLSVYHNLIRQQMQPERTSSSSQSNTGDGSHQNEPKEQPPGSSSGYRSRYEEDKTSRSNQHKGPEKKTKWKAPITDHVERLVESRKKAGSGHADNERDRERIERDLRDSYRNGHDRERIERDLSESRRNGLDREREMNDREHPCETERERGRSELERERERSERDRDRERDRERERAERERDRNERERERERNEHEYKRSKDFIHTNGVLVDLNYRYNSKDTDALLRPELSSSARNSQAPLSHDSIKVNPLVEKYQHKTVNGNDMPPKNLDNYDPGNPIALKRRIADLESQVADMTEANETTQANLQEKQAKLVTLQGNWERRQRELEDDNANLRYKVSQLEAELLKSGSTQQLQDELVELRSDLRALRDKNHQLVQDNILLTEHLKDATRDQRSLSPTRKNLRNQDHPHRSGGLSQSTDRYRAERDINTRSLRNQFGGSCDVLYSSRQSSLGEIDRIHEKTKNAVISDKPSDKRYDERYDNRHQKAESPSSHERSTSPVSQRERRLSDVSDSTAILTSMPPTGIDEEGIDQTDTRRTTTAQANGNESRADRLRTSPPGTPPSAPPGLRGSKRPCSPRPVVTQHNKGYTAPASTTGEALNLAGRHPFSPRTPADLSHGDVVKFSRQGGKISKGVIKYIGHLPSKNDTYLGVELEHEIGKHDGVYDGQRYFQSKHNRGVFVAFSKVVMAWHGSEEETL